MVEVPVPQEKWSGKIVTVALGNTPEEGGSRSSKLMLGGETGMPFLSFEGLGHRQRLAGEVLDDIEGITEVSIAPFIDVAEDPAAWAKKWAELGADVICLKLRSTNPEGKDASPEDAVRTVQDVLEAVDLPIIVYGCGSEEKDAKTMEAVSNACAKERVLLGQAEEGAYKSISAAATVNGHGIVAYSNLDVNLATDEYPVCRFRSEIGKCAHGSIDGRTGHGSEYLFGQRAYPPRCPYGRPYAPGPMLCDLTSAWETREATEENDAG